MINTYIGVFIMGYQEIKKWRHETKKRKNKKIKILMIIVRQ